MDTQPKKRTRKPAYAVCAIKVAAMSIEELRLFMQDLEQLDPTKADLLRGKAVTLEL